MKAQLEYALFTIRKHGWWNGMGTLRGYCLVMALGAASQPTNLIADEHDGAELIDFVSQFLPKGQDDLTLAKYSDITSQGAVEALLEDAIAHAEGDTVKQGL